MAQDYDVSLKLLFAEWLNVELPRVSNPRVDMLARTQNGALCNLEVQSSNSSDMPRRQAEYYLDLHRLFGEHVRQVVLYIGEAPLSMLPHFLTPAMRFHYELVDVRQFDGEALLASGDLGERARTLMPLSIDVVLNNKVLGPAFRRHLEEGHEKGRREGRMEGRMEGEIAILRRLLQARFGPIPSTIEQRLHTASEADLNLIADRALTAVSLEDLFPQP